MTNRGMLTAVTINVTSKLKCDSQTYSFETLARRSTQLSSDLVRVALSFGRRNCRDTGRLCCLYKYVIDDSL
jgi:hypothetical protein